LPPHLPPVDPFSLDSLVRIETFQWVARLEPQDDFSSAWLSV
jgi:hypothetical protein